MKIPFEHLPSCPADTNPRVGQYYNPLSSDYFTPSRGSGVLTPKWAHEKCIDVIKKRKSIYCKVNSNMLFLKSL